MKHARVEAGAGDVSTGRGLRRASGRRIEVIGLQVLLLAAVLIAATTMRMTGLNWDEGQWIHPDEGHMRTILSTIELPERAADYFDTHRSSLNPRNNGQQYSYGTLPMFVTRALAEWLDTGCDVPPAPLARKAAQAIAGGEIVAACRSGTFTGVYGALVGRFIASVSDVATVALMFLLGRRLLDSWSGLLTAALGAFTAFSIQQAHFFTVDSVSTFFILSSAWFSLRAAQEGHWYDFALGGLCVGLASACKVSSALASLLVAFAALVRVWRGSVGATLRSRRLWVTCVYVLLAAGLCLVAFRVGQPYAFEGPGFFGLRPSPEWFGRLSQIQAEQSGKYDFPSGRQWANRAPLVFPWVNMVFWGMGLPLGLTAWSGWAVNALGLAGRRRRDHLVIWGWCGIVFLYLGTRWVKTLRYFLPLFPLLTALGAYLLVRCIRSRRRGLRFLGWGATVVTVIGTLLWGTAVFSIYTRMHTRLAASRWIYENVPAGSTVANEHWDWGLPLRVDGKDGFRGNYSGIEMALYDEDTEEKRERLYGWLDEADYIFLASNRLYGSIPRIPRRYPLTIAYYRELFAGGLGFELAADFTSYPALGPFLFPDQENPFLLMEPDYQHQSRSYVVELPVAEEAFSVYDHPRVLIFRKTEDYSAERVRAILGEVDVERALHGLTARQATIAPSGLQFPDRVWEEQRAGGTWADMFNRDSLLNRHPGLAAFVWWGVVTASGVLVFPLLFVMLPGLRDRGYGLSKAVSLLFVAYLTWLMASLRALPNVRATIWRVILFLALIGASLVWLRRRQLRQFLARRWRTILFSEGVFAGVYLLWLGIRCLNPDLWHPVVGGEKPMDFAYFNAIMKSTWFPPYNPWLSGGIVNYYYFGFVMIGALTQLVGTVPAIAYNLAIPMLCALTATGAFSIGHTLVQGQTWRERVKAGLLAALCVVLVGNLGVVKLLRDTLMRVGDVSFPSLIPGFPETISLARGIWRVLFEGARLPLRPEAWYWYPTRIIPAAAGEAGPISEFPAFSFLYADLHAHVMALPMTLIAIAFALSWSRTRRPGMLGLLTGAMAVGALRATNTWDYPTYLMLGIVALAVGIWKHRKVWRTKGEALGALTGRAALFVLLSLLLYMPYSKHYAPGYMAIKPWQGSKTPLGIYLWIHAIQLVPIISLIVLDVVRLAREHGHRRVTVWLLPVAVGTLAAGIGLAVMGYRVAALLVPLAGVSITLALAPRRTGGRRILWMLVAGSALIGLLVEGVVLKGDIGRMNTVFKFYFQAWVLLSLAAAVAIVEVSQWLRVQKPRWAWVWRAAITLLLCAGGLFLPFGVWARATDRIADAMGMTLDGMAFMQHAAVSDGPVGSDTQVIPLEGDYHAIRFMQDRITGSPVILEGLGRREYLWGSRVSVYTGLPAVVGWRWHQVQQRPVLPSSTVQWRIEDVNRCYNTEDPALALEIMETYDVRFVYVGAYEKAYYSPEGLAKFEAMHERGTLSVFYRAAGVTVYEVAPQQREDGD